MALGKTKALPFGSTYIAPCVFCGTFCAVQPTHRAQSIKRRLAFCSEACRIDHLRARHAKHRNKKRKLKQEQTNAVT
jgi:hypothetical protein